MEIQHFSHEHNLVLSENVNERVWCSICERSIKGPNYACLPCKYYLHKSCAELPQHMDHCFHDIPHHTLTLCNARAGRCFWCESCEKSFDNAPSYKCYECDFDLDIRCASMVQKINHPFHPPHPLVLFACTDYWCESCHKGFDNAFVYKCVECNFNLDVNCALMEDHISYEGQEHIQHFSHQHPMKLVGDDNENGVLCYACLSWRSAPTYGCTTCMYYLHKSCAELPLEIRHPFHPSHDLLLRDLHGKTICNSCHKDGYNFVFHCKDCDFNLDIDCILLKPTIKYYGHNHLLCLMEDVCSKLKCDGYETYCKQSFISDDFRRTQSYMLRCVECDFNLHLLCCSLPCAIKHKCHIHPLTLYGFLKEDDSDEYYCDACETERDIRICVYYCAECKYIAHVHCVISEVIKILKGDPINIKLRSVEENKLTIELDQNEVMLKNGKHISNNANLTLNDLVQNLNEDELLILDTYFDLDASQGDHDQHQSEFDQHQDTDSESIQEFSLFNDQDLEKLCRRLDNVLRLGVFKLKSKDLALTDIIRVEGYLVPWNLASVFKDLLNKYGDLSEGSKLTLEMKSLTYCLLCRVLNSMRKTWVVDITEDLLKEWYFYLKYVKACRFKLQFVFAHLEEVRCAYFGLQASKHESEISKKLDRKIEELEKKLNRYKDYREQLEEDRSCMKSDLMKQCLSKASELKWKTASDGLL
ncbi:hypothetical protein FNV43_RR22149 [Rhamnella rubrinervis]|uniref:Phorbol-ester/DAG-type domain-containing protein n=1 Tax=Rhamnella rubrinervis TaxID=2594499 RepID=A0A8K0DPN9_9ROSA|nr:hypothetical protein FNV43_RR22149 [Rhamnella rubrinervis]